MAKEQLDKIIQITSLGSQNDILHSFISPYHNNFELMFDNIDYVIKNYQIAQLLIVKKEND